MQPHPKQIIEELLDPRLMRARRKVIRPSWGIRRVLPADAVHSVQLLGLFVVRLHVVVRDRPRRRHPAVVPQCVEVLLPEPVKRRSVDLGGPTHEVVDLRLEGPAGFVVPGVLRDVAVVDEDRRRVPVLRLRREPIPAFENQHALSRGSESMCESAAASTRPDDDHVVVLSHQSSWRSAVGRMPSARDAVVARQSNQSAVRRTTPQMDEMTANMTVNPNGVKLRPASCRRSERTGTLSTFTRPLAPCRTLHGRSGAIPTGLGVRR